jgi:hypothetical protein
MDFHSRDEGIPDDLIAKKYRVFLARLPWDSQQLFVAAEDERCDINYMTLAMEDRTIGTRSMPSWSDQQRAAEEEVDPIFTPMNICLGGLWLVFWGLCYMFTR